MQIFSFLTPVVSEKRQVTEKQAIVLAMFGTTVPSALEGVLNIERRFQAAYPETTIRLAFTSNMIRHIWQKRKVDSSYLKDNPTVPAHILQIQGVLATIANLQDIGYRHIVVQPTHITAGEEFIDLATYIKALASIKTIKAKYTPFQRLALGRPVLGTPGTQYPYADDIRQVATILAEDAALARREDAILLYMGHGNDYFPSGGLYLEFAARMRQNYPNVPTYIGTVEGYPSFDEILPHLSRHSQKKIILKPFMVVAGNHTQADMAGPTPDAWKTRLEKAGYEVMPVLKGLGEQDGFADLLLRYAHEAATAAGIDLR